MTYTLNDSQKEILGREMQPNEIDAWVNGIWDIAEEKNKGSGNAAVEAKISIIESSRSAYAYDEMRRRSYPDIGDQLDDLYHKGAFSDEMAAKLKAVKDAYSKE
tara:strand:- start:201 stop:512 length:312 start_codon:yes stop_codon:yes gene_type:complete